MFLMNQVTLTLTPKDEAEKQLKEFEERNKDTQ
jgi:hypothetical protein